MDEMLHHLVSPALYHSTDSYRLHDLGQRRQPGLPLSLCILRSKPEPTDTKSLTAFSNRENNGFLWDRQEKEPLVSNTECTADRSLKTDQDDTMSSVDRHSRSSVVEGPLLTAPEQEYLPRTCEYCKKDFAKTHDLQIHIDSVHLKQKIYSCDHCEKFFYNMGNLRSHFRHIHLKNRPLACGYCEKTFIKKSVLQTHVKTVHLKQRPFTCEHCGASFTQNDKLKRHIRCTHSDDRPHACKRCNKSFPEKSNLRKHMQSVHFKCCSIFLK
ncbi:unnamed protein product [Dicrocoelium dendriticum]|nr:unnamed protein product [Dicrocoelium dendriticum]